MRLFSKHTSSSETKKSPPALPNKTPRDWERQAVPARYAMSGGVRRIVKENRALLQSRLTEASELATVRQGESIPTIVGYWAVTEQLADAMFRKGVSGALYERDAPGRSIKPDYKSKIYAWDVVAAAEALSRAEGTFEGNSSQDVRIVELAMVDPEPDTGGLLQWQVDPDNAEVSAIYTPDQFRAELPAIRAFAGHAILHAMQTSRGPSRQV